MRHATTPHFGETTLASVTLTYLQSDDLQKGALNMITHRVKKREKKSADTMSI